jgi:hypothetical protein
MLASVFILLGTYQPLRKLVKLGVSPDGNPLAFQAVKANSNFLRPRKGWIDAALSGHGIFHFA